MPDITFSIGPDPESLNGLRRSIEKSLSDIALKVADSSLSSLKTQIQDKVQPKLTFDINGNTIRSLPGKIEAALRPIKLEFQADTAGIQKLLNGVSGKTVEIEFKANKKDIDSVGESINKLSSAFEAASKAKDSFASNVSQKFPEILNSVKSVNMELERMGALLKEASTASINPSVRSTTPQVVQEAQTARSRQPRQERQPKPTRLSRQDESRITNLERELTTRDQQLQRVTQSLRNYRAAVAEATKADNNFGERVGYSTARLAAYYLPANAFLRLTEGIKYTTTAVAQLNTEFNRLSQVLDNNDRRASQFSKTVVAASAATGQSTKDTFQTAKTLIQNPNLFRNDQQINQNIQLFAKAPLVEGFDHIKDSVEGVSSALNTFQKQALDANRVLDITARLAQKTGVDANDFFDAIKTGGATFQEAGGKIEQYAAIIGALRQRTGLSTGQIGAGLNAAFERLSKADSIRVQERLVAQNGGSIRESDGQLKPVYERIKLIAEATRNYTEKDLPLLVEKLADVREVKTFIPLLEDLRNVAAGTSQIERNLNEVTNSAGAFSRSASKGLQSIQSQFAQVRETYSKVFESLAEDKGIQELVKSVASLSKGLANALQYLTPFVATFLKIGAINLGGAIIRNIGPYTSGISKYIHNGQLARNVRRPEIGPDGEIIDAGPPSQPPGGGGLSGFLMAATNPFGWGGGRSVVSPTVPSTPSRVVTATERNTAAVERNTEAVLREAAVQTEKSVVDNTINRPRGSTIFQNGAIGFAPSNRGAVNIHEDNTLQNLTREELAKYSPIGSSATANRTTLRDILNSQNSLTPQRIEQLRNLQNLQNQQLTNFPLLPNQIKRPLQTSISNIEDVLRVNETPLQRNARLTREHFGITFLGESTRMTPNLGSEIPLRPLESGPIRLPLNLLNPYEPYINQRARRIGRQTPATIKELLERSQGGSPFGTEVFDESNIPPRERYNPLGGFGSAAIRKLGPSAPLPIQQQPRTIADLLNRNPSDNPFGTETFARFTANDLRSHLTQLFTGEDPTISATPLTPNKLISGPLSALPGHVLESKRQDIQRRLEQMLAQARQLEQQGGGPELENTMRQMESLIYGRNRLNAILRNPRRLALSSLESSSTLSTSGGTDPELNRITSEVVKAARRYSPTNVSGPVSSEQLRSQLNQNLEQIRVLRESLEGGPPDRSVSDELQSHSHEVRRLSNILNIRRSASSLNVLNPSFVRSDQLLAREARSQGIIPFAQDFGTERAPSGFAAARAGMTASGVIPPPNEPTIPLRPEELPEPISTYQARYSTYNKARRGRGAYFPDSITNPILVGRYENSLEESEDLKIDRQNIRRQIDLEGRRRRAAPTRPLSNTLLLQEDLYRVAEQRQSAQGNFNKILGAAGLSGVDFSANVAKQQQQLAQALERYTYHLRLAGNSTEEIQIEERRLKDALREELIALQQLAQGERILNSTIERDTVDRGQAHLSRLQSEEGGLTRFFRGSQTTLGGARGISGVSNLFAAGGPIFNARVGATLTHLGSQSSQFLLPLAFDYASRKTEESVSPIASDAGELQQDYLDQIIKNRRKRSESAALSGASTGAITGGLIGSALPGLGTLVGAAAGALIGSIGGRVFGSKERQQDTYNQLLEAASKNATIEGSSRGEFAAISQIVSDRGLTRLSRSTGRGGFTSEAFGNESLRNALRGQFQTDAGKAELANFRNQALQTAQELAKSGVKPEDLVNSVRERLIDKRFNTYSEQNQLLSGKNRLSDADVRSAAVSFVNEALNTSGKEFANSITDFGKKTQEAATQVSMFERTLENITPTLEAFAYKLEIQNNKLNINTGQFRFGQSLETQRVAALTGRGSSAFQLPENYAQIINQRAQEDLRNINFGDRTKADITTRQRLGNLLTPEQQSIYTDTAFIQKFFTNQSSNILSRIGSLGKNDLAAGPETIRPILQSIFERSTKESGIRESLRTPEGLEALKDAERNFTIGLSQSDQFRRNPREVADQYLKGFQQGAPFQQLLEAAFKNLQAQLDATSQEYIKHREVVERTSQLEIQTIGVRTGQARLLQSVGENPIQTIGRLGDIIDAGQQSTPNLSTLSNNVIQAQQNYDRANNLTSGAAPTGQQAKNIATANIDLRRAFDEFNDGINKSNSIMAVMRARFEELNKVVSEIVNTNRSLGVTPVADLNKSKVSLLTFQQIFGSQLKFLESRGITDEKGLGKLSKEEFRSLINSGRGLADNPFIQNSIGEIQKNFPGLRDPNSPLGATYGSQAGLVSTVLGVSRTQDIQNPDQLYELLRQQQESAGQVASIEDQQLDALGSIRDSLAYAFGSIDNVQDQQLSELKQINATLRNFNQLPPSTPTTSGGNSSTPSTPTFSAADASHPGPRPQEHAKTSEQQEGRYATLADALGNAAASLDANIKQHTQGVTNLENALSIMSTAIRGGQRGGDVKFEGNINVTGFDSVGKDVATAGMVIKIMSTLMDQLDNSNAGEAQLKQALNNAIKQIQATAYKTSLGG